TCPPGYPTRHVFFETVDYNASCTPCQCDAPVGTDCKADVSAFTGPSCNPAELIFEYVLSIGPPPPVCELIQANVGVMRVAATWAVNQPGKCMPNPNGGQPKSTAYPNHKTAHEFCCAE